MLISQASAMAYQLAAGAVCLRDGDDKAGVVQYQHAMAQTHSMNRKQTKANESDKIMPKPNQNQATCSSSSSPSCSSLACDQTPWRCGSSPGSSSSCSSFASSSLCFFFSLLWSVMQSHSWKAMDTDHDQYLHWKCGILCSPKWSVTTLIKSDQTDLLQPHQVSFVTWLLHLQLGTGVYHEALEHQNLHSCSNWRT